MTLGLAYGESALKYILNSFGLTGTPKRVFIAVVGCVCFAYHGGCSGPKETDLGQGFVVKSTQQTNTFELLFQGKRVGTITVQPDSALVFLQNAPGKPPFAELAISLNKGSNPFARASIMTESEEDGAEYETHEIGTIPPTEILRDDDFQTRGGAFYRFSKH